jgi:hypothetical protein
MLTELSTHSSRHARPWAGIHVFLSCEDEEKTWMAGTSPAMTKLCAFEREQAT